jgi:hypothetical protein
MGMRKGTRAGAGPRAVFYEELLRSSQARKLARICDRLPAGCGPAGPGSLTDQLIETASAVAVNTRASVASAK